MRLQRCCVFVCACVCVRVCECVRWRSYVAVDVGEEGVTVRIVGG